MAEDIFYYTLENLVPYSLKSRYNQCLQFVSVTNLNVTLYWKLKCHFLFQKKIQPLRDIQNPIHRVIKVSI